MGSQETVRVDPTVEGSRNRHNKKSVQLLRSGQMMSSERRVLERGNPLWKFDTLWEHPLGKGEATCHSSWLYSLCTEDTWKATARVHRVMEDW